MENDFIYAPTVGSHDSKPTIEELQARVCKLEEVLNEKTKKSEKRNKRPQKIRWGKIRKFFKAYIIPTFNFIPRLINSIARFKEAGLA